ncbi:MAG: SCO family protein [Gelidibacter sp.]
MKIVPFIFCFALMTLTACKNNTPPKDSATTTYQCPMKCEGDTTYTEPGSCPICNMALIPVTNQTEQKQASKEISDMSVFNLTSTWTNQNNETIHLKDLKGDVLVMVMIYTSCKAACPRLVADMRNIEARLPENTKGKVKMVFVSIDPNTDTPERLKAFAKENLMDQDPWEFLRSTEDNTREFAAVLAVNYKKISPMDFSHSNIISVFNAKGEMVFQQEGLGVNSDETIQHIEKAASEIM